MTAMKTLLCILFWLLKRNHMKDRCQLTFLISKYTNLHMEKLSGLQNVVEI